MRVTKLSIMDRRDHTVVNGGPANAGVSRGHVGLNTGGHVGSSTTGGHGAPHVGFGGLFSNTGETYF